MKRRALIKALGAAGMTAALPAINVCHAEPRQQLKILFMGGTGFIGPHMVRALLADGHEVTLFNRGKSNPHLFPELTKIRGDRLSTDIEQISNQDWDLIVDSSCYVPRAVELLMASVDTRSVRQYVFISTISVYDDFSEPGLHEGSKLATMEEDPDSEDTSKWYGALKVRCERQAENAMPGRVTKVRCGLIMGPGDHTDRFTFWPERVARSDEVLAPGDGDDRVQAIDARDLADWVALCVRDKLVGAFNSTSPAGRYTYRDLLRICREQLNPDAVLTWVPADFLDQQGVSAMQDLPLWVPPGTAFSGAWDTSAARAESNGLRTRPLEESVRDIHQWFQSLPEERRNNMRAGMSLQRQSELLLAWHSAQSMGKQSAANSAKIDS
jgi:2'-hydroxyisoflavone reductase